jgi:hypothetical protein
MPSRKQKGRRRRNDGQMPVRFSTQSGNLSSGTELVVPRRPVGGLDRIVTEVTYDSLEVMDQLTVGSVLLYGVGTINSSTCGRILALQGVYNAFRVLSITAEWIPSTLTGDVWDTTNLAFINGNFPIWVSEFIAGDPPNSAIQVKNGPRRRTEMTSRPFTYTSMGAQGNSLSSGWIATGSGPLTQMNYGIAMWIDETANITIPSDATYSLGAFQIRAKLEYRGAL